VKTGIGRGGVRGKGGGIPIRCASTTADKREKPAGKKIKRICSAKKRYPEYANAPRNAEGKKEIRQKKLKGERNPAKGRGRESLGSVAAPRHLTSLKRDYGRDQWKTRYTLGQNYKSKENRRGKDRGTGLPRRTKNFVEKNTPAGGQQGLHTVKEPLSRTYPSPGVLA